jgi:hypothetical protein
MSQKLAKVILEVNDRSVGTSEPKIFSAQSETDHDNFVFNFDPTNPNTISIYIIKTEPDRMIRSNASVAYEYDFSIRDIIISGPYYDTSAVYVSNPISLNSEDNAKYTIDRVALDVNAQSGLSSSVDFYIAKDNPDATSIDDFVWIPISPENYENKSSSNFIDFNGSNLDYVSFVNNSQVSSSSKNISYFSTESSTTLTGFEGVALYQIAKLNNNTDYVEPIILEGVNRYNWYRIPYRNGLSREISSWKNTILPGLDSSVNVVSSSDEISSSTSFWTAPGFNDGASVLISFELLCSSDISLEKIFTKDDSDSLLWDVSIYLNGNLLSTIPPNQASDSLVWNLKSGKNSIMIAIDAQAKVSANVSGGLFGSFTLMQQSRISEYGFVYQNYLSHVSPYILKSNNSVLNNVFSITEIDTQKYVISNKKIMINSRMYFYVNNKDSVNSIRIKAEMRRDIRNSKSTPMITSYRIKFKRSENISASVSRNATDILAR